jgi:hypothetical protein
MGRLRMRPNHAGAVIVSLTRYFEESHPELSNEQRLIHYRGTLRREIRRGMARVKSSVHQVIDDIECRRLPAPKENASGLIDFDALTGLCGQNNACGVKQYASAHRADLEKVREHLKNIPDPDAETTARIKGLRELYRNPKDNFEKGHCYRSGDALITQEMPVTCKIVTKNKKHIEPVCDSLAKTGIYYT